MQRWAFVVAAMAAAPFLFGSSPASSTGATVRISVDSGGNEANGRSYTYPGGISDDGRYVAFQSYATNLVANDHNQFCADSTAPFDGLPEDCGDIFVRDTQTGLTELVSVDGTGSQANGASEYPVVSDDGRFVAFSSYATNLVLEGVGAPTPQLYVRDRLLATTEMVSVSSDEVPGNWQSDSPSISGDGRYVAFRSFASNLVTGDTNGRGDIFVRDRLTGTTERVSVDGAGNQVSCQTSPCHYAPSISDDGSIVAFGSASAGLVSGDTNGEKDIFARDRGAGTTERVSVSSAEAEADGGSWDPIISGNGQYVAFVSSASSLDSNDVNTCPGLGYGGPSCPDVFVRDRGAGTTEVVSVSNGGYPGNGPSADRPAISDDGRYVAFTSEASNLAAPDYTTGRDVFLRDRQANSTQVMSLNDDGVKGDAASHVGGISGDGRYIGMTSEACNLVPADQNSAYDAFLRDRLAAGNPGATDCATLDNISIDTQDDATPANIATSIGTTERCSIISNDEVLNNDEDGVDTIEVDVVVGPQGVPAGRPMIGFQYEILYSPARIRLTAAANDLMLSATPGSDILDVSDPLPDVTGAWYAAAVDNTLGTGETGPGVLSRLTFDAISPGYSTLLIRDGWTLLVDANGQEILAEAVSAATLVVAPVPESTPCTDGDGDGIADGADNCPATWNPDQANHDADPLGDACEPDDDNAGVYDVDEVACGGDPIVAALRPERIDGPFFGVDDDGDGVADEPLASGTEPFDCDGDGYTGSVEDHVFGASARANQDPCGTDAWPSDFVSGGIFGSTNKVLIDDLNTFLSPRKLDQNLSGPADPNVRWDLSPGPGIFATDINISDLNALLGGPTAFPPMLYGARALGGPECPWPP